MCLAVPGRVEEIYEVRGVRAGKMNFGGVVKEVCLAFVPELAIGDYAIVHVGVAISKVDEESALQTLKLLEETGMLIEELNATSSPTPDSACDIGSSPVDADARRASPP